MTIEFSQRLKALPGYPLAEIPALKRRLIDWRRSRMGLTRWQFRDRVYERTLPSFHPLTDRPDGPDHGILADVERDRLPDVLGLQRAGGSKGPGRTQEAGSNSTSRAA